jgi:hypothetical protein
VQRIAVRLRVDRDRDDAELAQGRRIRIAILAAIRSQALSRKGAIAGTYSPGAVTLPDQLTVARGVRARVCSSTLGLSEQQYWATAVFCVAMATDWLDGRIARRRGVTSQLGSLLDPIADRFSSSPCS